jgi:hypothetical protein
MFPAGQRIGIFSWLIKCPKNFGPENIYPIEWIRSQYVQKVHEVKFLKLKKVHEVKFFILYTEKVQSTVWLSYTLNDIWESV